MTNLEYSKMTIENMPKDQLKYHDLNNLNFFYYIKEKNILAARTKNSGFIRPFIYTSKGWELEPFFGYFRECETGYDGDVVGSFWGVPDIENITKEEAQKIMAEIDQQPYKPIKQGVYQKFIDEPWPDDDEGEEIELVIID